MSNPPGEQGPVPQSGEPGSPAPPEEEAPEGDGGGGEPMREGERRGGAKQETTPLHRAAPTGPTVEVE